MTRDDRRARFWSWFAANEARFRDVEVPEKDALLDELMIALHAYSPRVSFEVGGVPGSGVTELVLTAEGQLDVFPEVAHLVDGAPELEGWSVVAFVPAMGFEFTTEWERVEVDPKRCWFLPMSSEIRPEALGLRVGCPSYDASSHADYDAAIRLVLRTALGEVVYARDIQHVEVDALPDDPVGEDYLPLVELADYLDLRRESAAMS